ncbi:QacE family quaternary ammonium compound efflux SMR transporter [Peribacillus butanolivorans]|uniref:QacE family quaternary ammonium compound efflux SMR transporter n=1 Tax=Peribacillus butanolivorans TaxID=421767 RepID=A0AAX0RWD7_9BACI|nr:multidrug efflux SMR transporter [Peribacillus butanolivorans]AXN41514.1 QacE family quaternary ammonium compound efflux SMR transporter [Peribacillus butanolivorans]PEJ27662.1 QacE family quaternary ammonium compound efflux SMR transporter [Peribacillus butanolivorans]
MAWFFLLIAGFAEIGSVISLKRTDGFKKLLPSVACLFFGSLSFYFLSLSLTSIPVGTAYAIWTSIGSVGTVLAGMIFFNEPKSLRLTLFIMCIIAGAVGIQMTSGH